MMRTMLPILLLLSACGGGEESGNNSGSEEDTVPAAPQEPVSENLSDDPNNSVQPLTPVMPPQSGASATPTAGARVSAAFHGRWGMVDNDCIPGRSDNKGLMIVSAEGLGFYESRGAVERVAENGPNALTLDLSFTGEGEQWNRRETLTLQDGGRTLVREEQRPAGSFRYIKCPAGRETPVDQRGA